MPEDHTLKSKTIEYLFNHDSRSDISDVPFNTEKLVTDSLTHLMFTEGLLCGASTVLKN